MDKSAQSTPACSIMRSFLEELCSSISTVIPKDVLALAVPHLQQKPHNKPLSFQELNAFLPTILASCSVMSPVELAQLKDFIILCTLLTCYEEVSGETKHLIMQRLVPEFAGLWSTAAFPASWLEDFWSFSLALSKTSSTE